MTEPTTTIAPTADTERAGCTDTFLRKNHPVGYAHILDQMITTAAIWLADSEIGESAEELTDQLAENFAEHYGMYDGFGDRIDGVDEDISTDCTTLANEAMRRALEKRNREFLACSEGEHVFAGAVDCGAGARGASVVFSGYPRGQKGVNVGGGGR